MKKISIVLMIVGTLWTAQAQKPTHYVGLSAKLGYSAMLDNMNKIGLDTVFYSGKNSVLGGVATGLDATYELQVQKFRFYTGLSFDYLNAATRIGDFTVNRELINPGYPMSYQYDYTKMNETRNALYLSLPVMFGAYFNRYYFFVGPKVGINLFGNYTMKSKVLGQYIDDELIGDGQGGLGVMPNHGADEYKWKEGAQKFNFNTLNLAVAGEFGVNLDEWLAVKPKRGQRRGRNYRKTFKESLHYRAGVYFEYGVLNINNYAKNLADADARIASGANTSGNDVPAYVTGGNKPTDMAMSTQLGTKAASNAALNPLTVGAKFTVLYEIPKKKPIKFLQ